SDRMMFLDEGEVLRKGTPREIKEDIHVKVLEVAVEEPTDDFASVVEDVGGTVEGGTATFDIGDETEIIE
ncbi:MAG: hypothetical protein SVS85_01105, partial [Candidatus Nanohaloarchaea archaeon]|nr:hypothetical protein [Candidatus Nanohaloarchaea archaeon]